MDINQKLLLRKQAKQTQRLNKILRVKRQFKNVQKYEQLDEKLKNDPQADKKAQFYEDLFHRDEKFENEVAQQKEERKQKWLDRQKYGGRTQQAAYKYPAIQENQQYKEPQLQQNPQQQQEPQQNQEPQQQQEMKSNRKKKQEQQMVKKIFKEKTRRGQPVMKNLINYVVNQLENEKKKK